MYKKYQFGGIINQLSSTPFKNSNPLEDLDNFKSIGNNNKSSKFGNKLKGIGSFINNNTSLISAGLDAFSTANNSGKSGKAQTDQTSLSIKNAAKSMLNSVPGGQILSLTDSLFGAIGGGLGSATNADKILSAIPVVGNAASMFTGKTKQFEGNIADISTGEFGGVVQDSLDAKDISGVKSVSKNKLNNQITKAQNQFDKTLGIINFNKKRLNNDIGQSYQASLLDQYSGNRQLSVVGKKGMKFPELDIARNILYKISSPKKFQLGGKMNLLPDGELHARKHEIENKRPDLDGKITNKGIPVITNDGEQTAEIEKEEWVLRKELTDKLENLYKEYNKTQSDEIAIEAGKLICFELLKNTDDRSKLIRKVK